MRLKHTPRYCATTDGCKKRNTEEQTKYIYARSQNR